jgi:hypothetical protein
MKALPLEQQSKAVLHVMDVRSQYDDLMQDWRDRNMRVYDAVTTFEAGKSNDWDTNFKVNKAFEIENKWLGRLFAKAPNPIVSVRTDIFDEETDRKQTAEERNKKLETMDLYARAAQDYLKSVFNRKEQKKKIRSWVRSMVRYGLAHTEIQYRSVLRNSYREDGSKVEKVVDQYPTIENISFTDVFFDPRYTSLDEMPAFITVRRGVRFSELKGNKEYFNLDKIAELPDYSIYKEKLDTYKAQVANIAGIPAGSVIDYLDRDNLDITKFYGWFSETEDVRDEKYCELTIAGGILLIGYKEITEKPIEKISAFDDTETYFATGIVEPILGLMNETNFKKNAAAAFINLNLSRPFFWSALSQVNPSDLASAGRRNGGIIPVGGSTEVALKEIQEYPLSELNASYFQEQNNFERDMQNASFMVDTSQQPGEQALTNTATGAKIKFFESNAVIAMVRDNFEEGLRSLCYKLLLSAFDNIKGNVVIKKSDDTGFWEVNKEMFRNAIERFDIQIEIDSSSLEGPANRSQQAIALMNILMNAQKMGVNVNTEEGVKDVIRTMEGMKPEKYILPPAPAMGQMVGGSPIAAPVSNPSEAAQTTQDVIGKASIINGL